MARHACSLYTAAWEHVPQGSETFFLPLRVFEISFFRSKAWVIGKFETFRPSGLHAVAKYAPTCGRTASCKNRRNRRNNSFFYTRASGPYFF